MFGYVTVNPEALTQAQRDRFQAFYCGLCRCLRREYGLKGQMTLSFDMTFLLLTLSSLYEPEEQSGEERCAPHPRKKHAWVENEFTAYAADMNLALAYHKLMDDWADERNLLRRVGAEALKRGYRRVEARWGEKCAAIEKGVRDLSAIEKRREMDIDAPANCFGELLGELFVYRHDQWEAPCGPWARIWGGLFTSWTLTTTSPPTKSAAPTTPSSPSRARALRTRWKAR